MKVAVVKYNAGNIRSVDYALKRLGVEAVITADKEILQSADKVIFPGVGEAGTTMNHLKATGLDELSKNLRQPVFGICLWAGIRLVRQTANCSKDSPKKSLSTLYTVSMCRFVTLLLLKPIISIRSARHCIKITFMPPSSIRRKAGRQVKGF